MAEVLLREMAFEQVPVGSIQLRQDFQPLYVGASERVSGVKVTVFLNTGMQKIWIPSALWGQVVKVFQDQAVAGAVRGIAELIAEAREKGGQHAEG